MMSVEYFRSLDEICSFIKRKRLGIVDSKPKKKVERKRLVRKDRKPEKDRLWQIYRDKIVELWDKGYTMNRIASELGISYSVVVIALRKSGRVTEPRGRMHKVYRRTLEILSEYFLNPSFRELKERYGKIEASRVMEFLRNTEFPRPRFISEYQRKEVSRVIRKFLKEHPDKDIFTLDEVKPLVDSVKKYHRMWKGKVDEMWNQIKELYDKGYSVSRIARILKISPRSVRGALYKHGIKPCRKI